MDSLFEGVRKFTKEGFAKNKDFYSGLSRSQNPHTLFIGCSDSRLVPENITNTLPGELFVVRNIANVVPYYRESSEYLSTTSAIEFAVQVLGVSNIVVCGHSNCGGCKAVFLKPEQMEAIPHTRKWIELACSKEVVQKLIKPHHSEQEIESIVEKANIVQQVKHLLTYPFIKERYDKGEMKIFGWYYNIGEGEVWNYNHDSEQFEVIE